MAQDTYEIWARLTQPIVKDGAPPIEWSRIVAKRGKEEIDTFESWKEAKAAAENAKDSDDYTEIVVIQRMPVLRLNAAGARPNRKKGEDVEKEEEERDRKKGDAESPSGGFRLLKKKEQKHEDGVRGDPGQGGGAGAAP